MEASFTGYRDGSRPNMGRKLPAGATLQREEIMLGAALRIADSIEAMSTSYVALQLEVNRLNAIINIKSKEIAVLKSKFKGRGNVKMPELRVPSSWQKFNTEVGLHPTQKPVALMEYLIKTYTNEGETVLDNCMGSGTTAIACLNLNRNFIGMELDEKIFATAQQRIANHKVPSVAMSILNL